MGAGYGAGAMRCGVWDSVPCKLQQLAPSPLPALLAAYSSIIGPARPPSVVPSRPVLLVKAVTPPRRHHTEQQAKHTSYVYLTEEEGLCQPRVPFQHRPPQGLPRRRSHLAAEGAVHILRQAQARCPAAAAVAWMWGREVHNILPDT